MHDSEQEHSGITGCRVTYESTIFYNEANKFSMGAILMSTFIAMSAAMNVRFAKKSLSVCRASELLVPVSSVGYALPAMSRLLAYAETVRFMETAFPSVPIASARTR